MTEQGRPANKPGSPRQDEFDVGRFVVAGVNNSNVRRSV